MIHEEKNKIAKRSTTIKLKKWNLHKKYLDDLKGKNSKNRQSKKIKNMVYYKGRREEKMKSL